MRTIRNIFAMLAILVSVFTMSAPVFAASIFNSGSAASGSVLQNPLNIGTCGSGVGNGTCLGKFLSDILQFVVEIGSVIVILMLVYTGFQYVWARGSAGKLEQLHQQLLWIIIGALVLLGAQAIALGIQATVNAVGG